MSWFAVVERATGILVSVGTVLADPMPDHLEALPLGESKFDSLTHRWDPATRTIVTKPAPLPDVDRVEEFIARVPVLASRLNAAQMTTFRTELGRLLGSARFRDPNDTTDLR